MVENSVLDYPGCQVLASQLVPSFGTYFEMRPRCNCARQLQAQAAREWLKTSLMTAWQGAKDGLCVLLGRAWSHHVTMRVRDPRAEVRSSQPLREGAREREREREVERPVFEQVCTGNGRTQHIIAGVCCNWG